MLILLVVSGFTAAFSFGLVDCFLSVATVFLSVSIGFDLSSLVFDLSSLDLFDDLSVFRFLVLDLLSWCSSSEDDDGSSRLRSSRRRLASRRDFEEDEVVVFVGDDDGLLVLFKPLDVVVCVVVDWLSLLGLGMVVIVD